MLFTQERLYYLTVHANMKDQLPHSNRWYNISLPAGHIALNINI